MKEKSGIRTLTASVLLSAPGPVVVGIGLFLGRSSTQLADFIRRTAELIAMIISLVIYRVVRRGDGADVERKQRLERISGRWVGVAMCVSGVAMAAASLLTSGKDKGNVIPGLAIAVLGLVTNTWFWLRYRKLGRENPDAIIAAQSRLYQAKSLVDACVTAALVVVVAAPESAAAAYMDFFGSLAVAVYMIFSGISALRLTSQGRERLS